MQDFDKRIGLVTSLHKVTGYSSGVNGKNQAKKKSLGSATAKRLATTKVVAHHGEKEVG